MAQDVGIQSRLLSELGQPFLNEAQRAVNRKVQGSNPCSGAKRARLLDSTPGLRVRAPVAEGTYNRLA